MKTIRVIDPAGEFIEKVLPSCARPLTIVKDGVKQVVPCGKCPPCRAYRRNIWNFRLNLERENSDFCFFTTLTYDDEHLDTYFDKKYIQNFHKRLRKYCLKYLCNVRYYFTSEYGSKTKRPHHHSIYFFDFSFNEEYPATRSEQLAIFTNFVCYHLPEKLTSIWAKGFVSCYYVNSARINYITHYHSRPKFPEGCKFTRKPFVMSSSHLGFKSVEDLKIVLKNGLPMVYDRFNHAWLVLPRYYRRILGIDLSDKCLYASFDDIYSNPLDSLHQIRKSKKIDTNYNTESF